MPNSTTHAAVRTEREATAIILAMSSTQCELGDIRCQCGITQAVFGYDDDFNQIGFVPFCEGCGDDDAIVTDVFVPSPKQAT